MCFYVFIGFTFFYSLYNFLCAKIIDKYRKGICSCYLYAVFMLHSFCVRYI